MVTPSTGRTKKYIISLKDINTGALDTKYGIALQTNIFEMNARPENTSSIEELIEANKDTSMDIISFLDESNKLYQCNVSMIDFHLNMNTNDLRGYKCYWCRHSFTSVAIGCPIRHVSNRAIKKYHSEVSKDDYTIKENITRYKHKLLKNQKLFASKNKARIELKGDEHYVTDGIFCSFNCCKAFILDNKHNSLYTHSEMLLAKLYTDMNKDTVDGESVVRINPAPSWRLLQDYGGGLSIDNFRENFNKCSYESVGMVTNFKSAGMLYDKKLNF